jgi:pyridoxal phosphate enzyme (YggS family)
MKSLSETLESIKLNISAAAKKSGRDASDVQIVAVTKTHSEDVVVEAWENSLNIVGENKVQEAMWKKLRSPSGLEWHLIGHLQTNKVRQALETFDFIHSVDSLKLIKKIYSVADEIGANVRILLEVNVSGEKSKTGMPVECVDEAVKYILEECSHRISLEGFMTMAPFSTNPEDSRIYFRQLRLLKEKIETDFNITLRHLSMGMSGDYEVAVEEGATFIRLGTILFGDRPKISSLKKSSTEHSLDSFSGEGPTVRILD